MKLLVKSITRGGKGTIVSGDNTNDTVTVEVKKLKGRQCYEMIVNGECKGITRLQAEQLWRVVCDYFNVWDVEIIEPKKKTKKVK